ncbi:protein mono-ADP-ribosyltransferase TIPARP [Xenopus laevis]|uniref:protein mono-ADP-ribosyltransferase TIPARP n=2 Tax=Xenopus laevis TaxID=8355 RepID=A0A1L8H3M1_XENLA|nr:protein mono-ADP-ribosyltransferase TIPARP [Xenopus laevis]XP_018109295.1 protein mono-ADP-ribosyltransferase TIPARP [Xenopus laevis]XP_018109296.1 protein mono-ADP-ribosyltransferase TIPARP [Xenopus laevis]XP_041443306.1 protein mono-ADP-ribosyltransferase TIPARP [Xenopus laevis]XP_041443307.1 protein mono-ADP-ribosyltransferase TIPARP [Xenopus laevis]OCT90700.1 hypothetical protein XELAEV_18019317mg [Xenopus laevis]
MFPISSPGICFSPYPLPGSRKVTGTEPTKEEVDLQRLEWGVEDTDHVPDPHHGTMTDSEMSVDQPDHTYFIHMEDDIEICSRFLLGKCMQGTLCPRHHAMLPYTWQLKLASTGMWYTVGGWAQEALERLFCNPAQAQVKCVHQKKEYTLDFTTMEVHHSPVFNRVRRLSTSTNPSIPFHTSYMYYYEEKDNNWVKYDPNFVESIEEGLREGFLEVLCSSFQFRYVLHLTKSYQENLQTNTKRRMRARPIFKSPLEMMSDLWTLRITGSCVGSNSNPPPYPNIWLMNNTSPLSAFDLVLLRCEDREFICVYRCFHKTMKETEYVILEISRIQNYFQWEKYTRKRDHIAQSCLVSERNRLERHLFHGTDHSVVEAICKQNFDSRVCGKHATSYGQGSYFSTNASYSHKYSDPNSSGQHFMFLAKVLVGRPALGKKSLRRPPPLFPKDPASPLYDSCVSRNNNPDIFVLFDNDQSYPYFLIKYQKIPEVVNVD